MRRIWVKLMVFLGTVLLCCGCEMSGRSKVYVQAEESAEERSGSDICSEEDEESKALIYVHVCGSVISPGVYELRSGDRVYKAVQLAGGICEDGDLNAVNQAQVLEDGMQIYVPDKGEASDITSSGSGLVNINKASKEELMTLPGIGESKASSIIAYREDRGRFSSIEDLVQVEGIKSGVYNKIKELISC